MAAGYTPQVRNKTHRFLVGSMPSIMSFSDTMPRIWSHSSHGAVQSITPTSQPRSTPRSTHAAHSTLPREAEKQADGASAPAPCVIESGSFHDWLIQKASVTRPRPLQPPPGRASAPGAQPGSCTNTHASTPAHTRTCGVTSLEISSWDHVFRSLPMKMVSLWSAGSLCAFSLRPCAANRDHRSPHPRTHDAAMAVGLQAAARGAARKI
jgi:hypothetical protein